MWWFLTISLLTLLYYIWQKQGSMGKKYLICMPHLPILGSLPYMNFHDPAHVYFTKLKEKYGNTFAFWMGPQYSVVVNHFSAAKEVLLKKGKDFASRPRMVTTDILSGSGKGIAFSEYGPQWRMYRKLVQSSFSLLKDGSQKLEKLICQEANTLCKSLAAAQGKIQDPATDIFLASSNVICQFCFSSSWNKDDEDFEIMMDYNSLVDIFPWIQARAIGPCPALFPNKDLALLKDSVTLRNELLKKKLEIQKEKFNIDSVNNLLDALLKAKLDSDNPLVQEPEITDEHILMTVGDIFGAGVETTSTVVRWCIAFLLHHPQVGLPNCSNMHLSLSPNPYPPNTGEDNSKCLKAHGSAVCSSPISTYLIVPIPPISQGIGEYTIPKGTRIYINLWSIHHDPTQWNEPERFMPERFLDKNKDQLIIPNASYFPFGSGPRVCVGEFLARSELFLFLAWILQRFDLEVPDDGELPSLDGLSGVVFQIIPFKLKVKLRKGWREAELSA
uniref:Steroid 17-alpha-hydroxylase/17,20 lyase n=1 Tax=Monodelphis domestica TaxID=13616 RepID=F6SQD6_MONDO